MKDLKILKKEFYSNKNTIELAKSLLGKYLVRELDSTILIGKINEVEAYLHDDPAAHTYRGKTERTKAMFEEAGTVYLYFSYGVHWCFNISGNEVGVGEGILIRGIEPIVGINTMIRNRNKKDIKGLTDGPAKVTQAFQIDNKLYGHKIWEPPLYIAEEEDEILIPVLIKSSPRIGILKNADAMLRFYL